MLLKTSPCSSVTPISPLNADGQLITFVEHGDGLEQKKKKNPNNFEEDSAGLKEGKAGIFGGSSFS